MDARVIAAFSTSYGVLRREQLLDLGVPPSEIRRMLRSGDLVRLRRGVYTTREVWEAADPYVARPLLLARAAVLVVRRAWVLSHDSAAHALGLDILQPDDPYVHLTRPGWTNAWTENGVKHHLARFGSHQVVEVDGLRVLDLARVAVDMGREHGFRRGFIACDSAMRMGVTRAELLAAAEPMAQWPGARAVNASVEFADPGAENVNESLGRELVVEAGIGTPETQFPVRTAEGIRWCDLRVGNHVIEVDGKVKYLSEADGGLARKSGDEVAWEERKRERLVRDEGLVVSRVYWEDYWGARRASAVRRLRADHADSVARFGAELDERLAREAAAIKQQYGDRRRGA
jgi:hypothetical protein